MLRRAWRSVFVAAGMTTAKAALRVRQIGIVRINPNPPRAVKGVVVVAGMTTET
jgi:hypothetical protein